VQVNFLPVGHTHVNVDVPFAMAKNYLKQHSIPSLEAMVQCLPKIFKKSDATILWTFEEIKQVIWFHINFY